MPAFYTVVVFLYTAPDAHGHWKRSEVERKSGFTSLTEAIAFGQRKSRGMCQYRVERQE